MGRRKLVVLPAGFLMAFLTPVQCLASDTAVSGCYLLRLSTWSPALTLGEDEKYIAPPARIKLTTEPDHLWDPHGLRVESTGDATPSVHRSSYWISDGNKVHIVFTTGHSGLTMDLEVHGQNLTGAARTFWDFSRTQQVSQVVATRVACEPKSQSASQG